MYSGCDTLSLQNLILFVYFLALPFLLHIQFYSIVFTIVLLASVCTYCTTDHWLFYYNYTVLEVP